MCREILLWSNEFNEQGTEKFEILYRGVTSFEKISDTGIGELKLCEFKLSYIRGDRGNSYI